LSIILIKFVEEQYNQMKENVRQLESTFPVVRGGK